MNQAYEKLLNCYESCRKRIDFVPKIALVLGSGLGDYADGIRTAAVLDYRDIEGFPQSTVEGHQGRFIFGYVKDVPVVCMQGRVHYYEGYSISDVVLPVRLMKLLGAEVLFLTNAAGGINLDYDPGDFMLIRDHISSFVPSPLIGENMNSLGPRFCDMSDTYDAALRKLIRDTAVKLDIPIQEGVYLQLTGPQYETPAEIRMARALGADAVGMSTACEAVAANHMGMKICGISCITNMAAGVTANPLSHEEVQETADRTAPLFKHLVTESIAAIAAAVTEEHYEV
jgi:purine-nucleoside phosphorylase